MAIKLQKSEIFVSICFCATLFLFSAVEVYADSEEEIEKILNAPSVIDNFTKAADKRGSKVAEENLPLMKQANAFGLYLDPPPPPPPARPNPPVNRAPVTEQPKAPVQPVRVSPKFNLVATSFFASRPELSLALIDEPGKGLTWVRQTDSIGHLKLEEIKNGIVVVNDGTSSYEVMTQKPRKVNLVVSEDGVPVKIDTAIPAAGTSKGIVKQSSAQEATLTVAGPEQLPSVDDDVMSSLVEKLKSLESADANYEQDHSAIIEEFISKLEATQIDTEEANSLGDLGKKMNTSDSTRTRTTPRRRREIPGK